MSVDLESATETPTVHHLGRRALSLAVAKSIDFAIQFLLPVVLVRFLDTEAFGQYRLLWLAVGTVMAVATMDMQAGLYYFMPRSDNPTKRLYVNQTLLFLTCTGLVSAWALSSWNPWLPEKISGLAAHDAIVPAFVLLWVVASLLDLLPTIEERVTWQAWSTVGLAALRAAALSLAAILTRELAPVLMVLLAFVAFKVALLLGYVAIHHGLRGPILRWRLFAGQLRYSAPLGAAGTLYGLRTQADQWVAATLFPLGMFASFSVAAVLGPLIGLCRLSVSCAFLPSMSRLEAAGDIRGMLELSSRANLMVAAFACPLLAFAFVFAEELVTIVYTAAYVGAAPVMRIYIIGLMALVVDLASITMLLRQAPFVMWLNLVALALAVALDWFAALRIGLAGAALGGVVVLYLDRVATLLRISGQTRVPLGRLQDWGTLARVALRSALAAALAWGMVDWFLATSGPLVRAVVGGLVVAAAYGAMHGTWGVDRPSLSAARNPERRA